MRHVSNTNDMTYTNGKEVSWARQAVRFLFLFSLTPFALVTTGLYMDGRSVAEKIATSALMPIGIVVFLLIGISLFAIRNGRWALALGFLFLASVTWLASSPIVANSIMEQLELEVQSQLPTPKDPLDVLIVLGGGTGVTPDARPQLSNSGDRIGLAIRLYHTGAIKKIVVTGNALPGSHDGNAVREPNEQSKQLLIESGVDESAISSLNGINTSEEMKSLKEHPEFWEGKRCGLLTSAFHLPRAMRLAEAQQLKLIPVAADYRGTRSKFSLRQVMPSGEAMSTFELALKEHLARLLGR